MTYDQLLDLLGDDQRFAVLDRVLDSRGVEMTSATPANDDRGAYLQLEGVRGDGVVSWNDSKLGQVSLRFKRGRS
jgi:hypothetical protein